MIMQYFFDLERVIDAALTEDIGTGDITTLTTIPADRQAHGRYMAKEDGVLCGVEFAGQVYHRIDPSIMMTYHFHDGDRIHRGDVIAEVEGNAVALLTGERVGLNLMQRLSGHRHPDGVCGRDGGGNGRIDLRYPQDNTGAACS